jgi:ADP-ribose pyrophosphatase YjhB (NUDIX family)
MKDKLCDNKSAGIMICQANNIVVIERRNYPEAYALPAGHLDGDDFKVAAIREAKEETGIVVSSAICMSLYKLDNPCKRVNGSYHLWEVYYANNWSGELKAGDDAKKVSWMSIDDLRRLAKRTEYFSRHKYKIPWYEVGALTRAIFGDPENKHTDPEWKEQMGLEPVWYFILRSQTDLQIV